MTITPKKLEEKETPQTVRYLPNREADETGSQTSLREAGAMLRSEVLPVFLKIKRNHYISHFLGREEYQIALSACS